MSTLVHLAATAALWLERLEGYVVPCILGKGAYGVRSEGRVDVCFEPKFTKFIAGGAEPGFPAREVFRQPCLMGDNGRVDEIKMNEEEEEDESNVSSSTGRTSRSTNNDHRKGAVGPPPSYDGNREAGVFERVQDQSQVVALLNQCGEPCKRPRLLQALSGKAFESVRHLIDDAEWLEAPDNGEQLLELLSKPEYYSKEELESLYQSMHKLFYSDLRKDDDDLPAFRSRFDQAVRKIKKHRVELPQEALGFLFLKQSRINAESFERLITLTNGDLKLDAVVEGLRRLKMKLLEGDEATLAKKRHLWVQDSIDNTIPEAPGDVHSDDEDIELIEQALADLDGDDVVSKASEVSEDGAKEILMTLIKQKIQKPMSMSYRQVQQQKRDVKTA